MYDYREVRAIKEGILINKEYYEFLHSYKENQELKEKLEKNNNFNISQNPKIEEIELNKK